VSRDFYAKWDPAQATDESDGKPDIRIVPTVEELRRRGIVTSYSCSGHETGRSFDGYLAVVADSVDDQSVKRLVGLPFSSIYLHIWPLPVSWVFRWRPIDAPEAMDLLTWLEPWPNRAPMPTVGAGTWSDQAEAENQLAEYEDR
jgi:hypothetical protein